MGLPAAAASLFQGALLFFLLGADVLVNYRVRVIRAGLVARRSFSA
jgi:simple sugar transport system permease protein